MKELFLLRHAQAADKEPGQTDFDRPLTKEGQKDADRIGRLLAHRDLRPDIIISSPAERAADTARRAAEAMGIPPSAIRLDPRIYEAGALVLAELAGHAATTHGRPMLVGHNPGFEQLAASLGGLGSGWDFPKGVVARFEIPDVALLRKGSGCRLVELLEP